MLTFLWRRIVSPNHEEFVSGTLTEASDAALITMSLTEILVFVMALSLVLSFKRLSTLTETVT
jgi:hypothetical protein